VVISLISARSADVQSEQSKDQGKNNLLIITFSKPINICVVIKKSNVFVH